jgi:hypothetical protein
VLGAFVGALAGLWIGVLGRLFLGDLPVSFSSLAEVAMLGAGCGLILGVAFPKSVLLLGFPFSTLGVGS